MVLDSTVQVQQSELDYDEDKDFLGGGACGEVFKATLKKAGKPEKTVAIKVFKDFSRRRKTEKSAYLLHMDSSFLISCCFRCREYEMFKKEAAILLQIDPHPSILRLIGLCAIPTFYALVTEFVSGGDLSSLLKSPEHKAAVEKWETRLQFAKQIADGMLHLHSIQPPVIHYDLKAQNVLVECIRHSNSVQFICKVDYSISTCLFMKLFLGFRFRSFKNVWRQFRYVGATRRFESGWHCHSHRSGALFRASVRRRRRRGSKDGFG